MGKKILVADDSTTIQKVIKLALSNDGYNILAVLDGHEALKAIEEEHPDVVLVDHGLSGMNAYEIKEACNSKREFSHIPVVLMVSAYEKVDEDKIQKLNFFGRLIKPFDPSHLRKIVAQATSATTARASIESNEVNENIETLPPIKPVEEVLQETKNESEEFSSSSYPPPFSEELISFDLKTEAQEETLPESTRKIIESLPPLNEIKENLPSLKTEEEFESDIRGLTQTTLEMAQTSEEKLDWSLDDTSKMPKQEETKSFSPPPPPPPSQVFQIGKEKSFLPSQGFDTDNTSFMQFIDEHKKESGTKEIELAPVDLPTIEVEKPSLNLLQNTAINLNNFQDKQDKIIISKKDLEKLVQEEVKKYLESIAKTEVPKIAEIVVRKEIERILQEP
jgi:CheY-like chemotaxis protein